MSLKKLFDLTGKVALITGGSRGLGLQIAEALGEMGAKLALTARKADELAQAKEHLERMHLEVFTLPCDHAKSASIGPVVEQIVKLKPPSVKGAYIKSVYLSTTMGPGVRLDVASLQTLGKTVASA